MSSWDSYNEYNTGWNLADEFLMDDAWLIPKSFLLDLFPATAAYSTGRKLKTGQQYAMQVRRESDNEWLNVGFDVFGNTDLVAIASFCGISDGFVATWYDATSNGYNASQAISTNQPKIYDGLTGLVVAENGRPALEFNGLNTSLDSNLQQQAGSISLWSVFKAVEQNSDLSVLISAGSFLYFDEFDINIQAIDGNSRLSVFDTTIDDSRYNNIPTINHNFQQVLMSCIADGLVVASGKYMIGACTTVRDSQAFKGRIQEMIIYQSDQTANRTVIENNINNYYSIY